MATYEITNGIPSSIQTGDILTCEYSGASKQLTLPKGIYIFECYGAQGGAGYSGGTGGLGGYAKGTIEIEEETLVFLYVGGQGKQGANTGEEGQATGGFNGGGACISYLGGGGGGATDIRFGNNSNTARKIVAGGGGGAARYYSSNAGTLSANGGAGGGTSGGSGGIDTVGSSVTLTAAGGGTQSGGGAAAESISSSSSYTAEAGSLGYGGDSSYGNSSGSGGGGGGGYYGGGGGNISYIASARLGIAAGGGGSGYISSDFTSTSNTSGQRSGDGFIRITVSEIKTNIATPKNFEAYSVEAFRATLTWDSVEDAIGYQLSRNEAVIANSIAGTSYIDNNLEGKTTYNYALVALAENPEENSNPATLSITTLDPTLSPPENFRATAITGNSVSLVWDAVTNATGYRITRNGTVVAPNIADTKFTDTGLSGYTQYVYAIIAVLGGKEQYNSSAVSITVNTPLGPPIFSNDIKSAVYVQNTPAKALDGTAVAALGTVTYQWQKSTETESWSDITGETNAFYTPSTAEIGTTFYRVVATVTYNGETAVSESNIAEITVESASVPIFVAPLLSATYDVGDTAIPLNGEATVINGNVSYQWYSSVDNSEFAMIPGATESRYIPSTGTIGTRYYYVVATNIVEGIPYISQSNTATITVINLKDTARWRNLDYRKQLKKPFIKLCRIRFLQPDGSTAFALDNNPQNKYAKAFISDGQISANLQNGRRRSATVTLSNVDARFDYDVNKIWFGNEIAIDEGLYLSDGQEYYIPQGIFLIENPNEVVEPGRRTITYNLVDKWANLDGTLFGNLEGTYEVPVNTNIFDPIKELLAEDRGNGLVLDRVNPIFTEYYNNRYQELPNGSAAALVMSPYTLTVDGESGTKAEVILGLIAMVNAWVGYDTSGALRIEPSQDDILDSNKPIIWQFSQNETQLLGLSYTVKNTEVFNDYIVIGEMLENYKQPSGRAQNLDPSSDTNINLIGRKTKRVNKAGYGTDLMCQDYAVWKLKRAAVLQKAVTVSCSQIMHIEENKLITIVRTDKPGSPVERHLVQSFTRPLASGGPMTISCVSVNDFPIATLTTWPE